jgi:hypothetical protein
VCCLRRGGGKSHHPLTRTHIDMADTLHESPSQHLHNSAGSATDGEIHSKTAATTTIAECDTDKKLKA